jgi:phosphomannomutase
MPKHVFFDLDDTLTPSRTQMTAEHTRLFVELCNEKDVIVVSGAQESQMKKQLPPEANGLYFILSQNGNHAISKDGKTIWSEGFSPEQVRAIDTFIKSIHDELALNVRDEKNLVEYRGSQISYSLIGHDEDREIKKGFDPRGARRKAILAAHAKDIEHLSSLGIEVTVGGTTCLDIYLLGKNKGFHIPRLIEQQEWSKEDSLYVGDALEQGRNDESVIGVIPTHAVKDPDDTFVFIKQMLN